jgi:hypothetical protein
MVNTVSIPGTVKFKVRAVSKGRRVLDGRNILPLFSRA